MNQAKPWFSNRVCLLATMHKKEQAIAALLEKQLEMQVVVPQGFNTDRFGTFTREIKRLGTQLEAARLKAQKVLEVTGESLAVASEGSFFPDPNLPYVSRDRELVLLLDRVHQLEIVGVEVSLETNYNHTWVYSVADAFDFAAQVGFPDHGLVLMSSPEPKKNEQIFKGIVTEADLIHAVTTILKSSPEKRAHLETDMRAMYNPTRMQVIAKATENLIDKIQQTCPNCYCPGFDVIERKPGLRCAMCNLPTSLIKSDLYQCQKCNFQETRSFPNQVEFADPTYCNYCNP
ncbi:MAG: hypothetical protein F6K45_24405 [Kamptonema sp. SIO1D9]|nr:hypothetical protein [Kamptonema sp. SIO1D9]